MTLYYNSAFSSTLKVLATIKPIHSLVLSVTDGILEPASLLSYNSHSVHDYSLKPSDIIKLESSNIIFYVNDELETFIQTFAKKNKKLVNLSSTIPLLSTRPHSFSKRNTHTHSEKDLHIWLSPENAKLMILFISETLSKIDNENSHRYNHNAIKAINEIDQGVKKIAQELDDFKNKKYIVTHDAYQYFEKYFGLRSPSIILSIEEDSYLGMKSLMKLKKIMKKENIKCIISHSQEDSINPKNFSKDTKMKMLDPIGSNTELGQNAYLVLISKIAKNFKSCFGD